MALELNGTTGVSLVQDGVVTAADLAAGAVGATQLASTLDLTGKSVTLPAGVGGKVLQVLQAFKTDTYSTTSTSSYVSVPGLSVSITPSSTSSKVLVIIALSAATSSDMGMRCSRNGTDIGYSTTASTRNLSQQITAQTDNGTYQMGLVFLDSPSSTSSLSYVVNIIACNGGTQYVNRRNYGNDFGAVSSITVMEIGA